MTVRINLLPHREHKRAARQRQFVLLAALTLGLGVVVALAGHTLIATKISNQEGRNAYLKAEIAKLDKEIEEIKVLKEKTTALLERKKVVEALQSNRSQVVHLLDQLVRQLPDGVYLKSIDQNGNEVKIVGYAQSNARVASLMRNLDSSEWLEDPRLIETKAVLLNNLRVSEFAMNIKLSSPKAVEGAEEKNVQPSSNKDKKA
ncbi:MAG: PilN domain-containing protein [Sulfurimicrobium sp.]|jgi:type IV pilus assembly protein PilN|nr:PilN domain-containing protein [Sulfurimicrobium sp.]